MKSKKQENNLEIENNQIKKILAEKELKLAIIRDLRDAATDRVIIAHKWISKDYKINLVLDFVGIAKST